MVTLTKQALRAMAFATMLAGVLGAAGCQQTGGQGGDAGAVVAGDPWTAVQVVKPADLAAQLKGPEAARPLLLHVGFPVLFRAGAIPGTIYAGEGRTSEGIAKLRETVKDLPRDKEIVLYCGCCPWDHCPNMRPAFATMHEMGFTHVRALHIPKNFTSDWVDAGFPVETPQH